MTFKEKVVKLRKLKGLTQDEFASAVGVSRQAVYKWESGQSYPEVAKLLEMKILFNISIDDLLDENYEVIVPEKKKKRISREVKREIEAAAGENFQKEPEPQPTVEEVKEPELVVAVVEEAAVEKAPAVEEAEPVPSVEKESEREDKKVGFFGRLFGRK